MKFISSSLQRWLGKGLALGLASWSALTWADEPADQAPSSDSAAPAVVSEEVVTDPDLLSRPLQSRPNFSLPNLELLNSAKLHTCPTYAQLREELVDVLKRNGVKSAEYYLPSYNELSPSLAEDDDYIPLVDQSKLSNRYVQIGPYFILKFSFLPRHYLPVVNEQAKVSEATKAEDKTKSATTTNTETKTEAKQTEASPTTEASKTDSPANDKAESKVLDTKKLEQALSQVKKQVTQKFSEAGLTKPADTKAKTLSPLPVKPAELAGQDDCLARVMVQFVKDPTVVGNQRLMQTLNYIYPLYGLSLASVTSNKEAETIGSQLILAQAVKNNQVNHYTVTEKGEKLGTQANFSSQEFIWGQYKLVSAVSSEFDVFVVENWGALWYIADPKAKEFVLPGKADKPETKEAKATAVPQSANPTTNQAKEEQTETSKKPE